MPEGAVYVGRPTRWGNPYRLNTPYGLARVPAVNNPAQAWEYEGRISADGARHDYFHSDGRVTVCHVRHMSLAEILECYEALLHADGRWPLDWKHDGGHYPTIEQARSELRGKDLVCWCPLNQPCHADVLLRLANEDPS